MMTDLKDKVVVVTGAAKGLGKALAAEFCRYGCHLALIDIDLIRLERTKSELQTPGQTITIHQADVSVEENIINARLDILNIHKHVDILVNNAGISISQNFEQIDLADYRQLFDVNFWGTVYPSKHFLPDLKKQEDTRLVNIISDFAFMGFPGKTAYGSSKSAVLGFTNALKTELADTNVKVCFVVPPPLDTELIKNGKHIDDKKRENEARFLEKNGLPLDKTANRIVKQIRKGKYRIIIGRMMFWVDIAARLFPTLLHRLIGKNKSRFDFV
jgi:short-subunit dehydrogenase